MEGDNLPRQRDPQRVARGRRRGGHPPISNAHSSRTTCGRGRGRAGHPLERKGRGGHPSNSNTRSPHKAHGRERGWHLPAWIVERRRKEGEDPDGEQPQPEDERQYGRDGGKEMEHLPQ